MSISEPCTVAVSDTGQYLGWVDDGDDIGAAIASFEALVGPVVGEVTVFQSVKVSELAPPQSDVLFKGTDDGKPFFVYR